MVLHLDLETYSSVDITKSGSFKYIESPDFMILLIAYAYDTGPVKLFDLLSNDLSRDPEYIQFLRDLTDPAVLKVAHNCDGFERQALRKSYGWYMDPSQWCDTMTLCSMNGLPMSLDGAGAALNLVHQKIKEGTVLINYFCKPCKPTISNKGRTRNLPVHAPDKWKRFCEYCIRDVEVMQTIYYKLCSYQIPEWEKQVRYTDCRINERGVLTDRELVESAVAVDEIIREKSIEELKRLTGLSNPNSISQLKEWVEAYGYSLDKLDKTTVSDLKKEVKDPTLYRVLELRQQICKTSSKKYQTMLASASSKDDRIRGVMQYYGAGRTGRWAGRLVQVQNLPQNHLDDIGTIRELVRNRDIDMLEMLFDSVPDVLSQLIRTALVAKPGHTFLVADYSAIEARVIAFLAGEQWRIDVFRDGGDIYCSSASQMFKVPVVKHGINGHLRQKGKIAELACIAEGQLVLTNHGLIKIEDITTNDKVWDGYSWVEHDGVICRGEKEVITYDGLTATADHIVWVWDEGKMRPVYFGIASSERKCLVKTGSGGAEIRLGDSYIPRTEESRSQQICDGTVQRVWSESMDGLEESDLREVKGLSVLLSNKGSGGEPHSILASEEANCRKESMPKSPRPGIQELRSPRDKVPVQDRVGSGEVPYSDLRYPGQVSGDRPDRYERGLCPGESEICRSQDKLHESEKISSSGLRTSILALCEDSCGEEACSRSDEGSDNSGCPDGGIREEKELEGHKSTVRVYDIRNAGRHHRFTVSNALVHNCGYGGGLGAMKNMGGDRMGLTDEEMTSIVAQWREASPTIPKFWREAESCAKKALQNPGKTFSMKCGAVYGRDSKALRLKLPSGRVLTYWDAHLTQDGQIEFMAQNQVTRKWEPVQSWGGRLVENIVQAFSRDVLALAMCRLEAAGYNIVFSVHDEVIVEEPIGGRTWQDVADIMAQSIPWADGLLLRADGYETTFYRKDD